MNRHPLNICQPLQPAKLPSLPYVRGVHFKPLNLSQLLGHDSKRLTFNQIAQGYSNLFQTKSFCSSVQLPCNFSGKASSQIRIGFAGDSKQTLRGLIPSLHDPKETSRLLQQPQQAIRFQHSLDADHQYNILDRRFSTQKMKYEKKQLSVQPITFGLTATRPLAFQLNLLKCPSSSNQQIELGTQYLTNQTNLKELQKDNYISQAAPYLGSPNQSVSFRPGTITESNQVSVSNSYPQIQPCSSTPPQFMQVQRSVQFIGKFTQESLSSQPQLRQYWRAEQDHSLNFKQNMQNVPPCKDKQAVSPVQKLNRFYEQSPNRNTPLRTLNRDASTNSLISNNEQLARVAHQETQSLKAQVEMLSGRLKEHEQNSTTLTIVQNQLNLLFDLLKRSQFSSLLSKSQQLVKKGCTFPQNVPLRRKQLVQSVRVMRGTLGLLQIERAREQLLRERFQVERGQLLRKVEYLQNRLLS